MTATFDQEAFWDPNIYSLPTTGSMEYDGTYPTVGLDSNFSVCASPSFSQEVTENGPISFPDLILTLYSIAAPSINTPQFETTLTPSPNLSSSNSDVNRDLSVSWGSPNQRWPSIESNSNSSFTSPEPSPNYRPKIALSPSYTPSTSRKARKPPSGEALERRRQQNRAAQLAFRERSKRQMEEMRLELSQSMEFNEKMYESVRGLLEKTRKLESDLEAVLAVRPPVTSLDAEKRQMDTPESDAQGEEEFN
jgi:hypothetical protein